MEGTTHKKVIEKVCMYFNADKTIMRGNLPEKNKYFPDATRKNIDIEVEILPKTKVILEKVKKWDKSRKKILVIGLKDYVLNNFDEVWVYNGDKFKLNYKKTLGIGK